MENELDTERFVREMGAGIGPVTRRPKRIYFDVQPTGLRRVVEYLFEVMRCRLSTATATDIGDAVEVLYHFSHDATGSYYCPRVRLDPECPTVPSIAPIVKGAEWIEREMMEFWGIEFEGHPRPERLLSRGHPQGLDRPMRLRSKP